MKFGVRECANITFKATSDRMVAGQKFVKGQPVLYIDSAKTSTLEGASTTVYAQGGRGNTRLIAWEGEKTLTFTVEDALLSPISFAMLSGAGLFGRNAGKNSVNVHMTTQTTVSKSSDNKLVINLEDVLGDKETISKDAPIFVSLVDEDGSIIGMVNGKVTGEGQLITIEKADGESAPDLNVKDTDAVLVDYYIAAASTAVNELQIDAEHFAGSYYVEADTLFRRQIDGVDLPASFTLPNVKIQSNFTFTMAGSGDPSTFTFTMDAFPGYTYFDKSKKVLCVLQVYNADNSLEDGSTTVMPSTTAHVTEQAEG